MKNTPNHLEPDATVDPITNGWDEGSARVKIHPQYCQTLMITSSLSVGAARLPCA
jgi:hypothetical protein